MVPSSKEFKQREWWGKMKKRGHLSYIVQAILICAASFALVRIVHILCFRLGWMQSPGSTSLEELLLSGALTGGIVGELHWSGMKRKFETLSPGEDRTIM
jgi:hypothetical protein